MTFGSTIAWRSKQAKQKKCVRCKLYYDEKFDKCSHCAGLDSSKVKKLIEKHNDEMKANFSLGKYFVIITLLLALLLLFSVL